MHATTDRHPLLLRTASIRTARTAFDICFLYVKIESTCRRYHNPQLSEAYDTSVQSHQTRDVEQMQL